jgi:hypothetical protein
MTINLSYTAPTVDRRSNWSDKNGDSNTEIQVQRRMRLPRSMHNSYSRYKDGSAPMPIHQRSEPKEAHDDFHRVGVRRW